MKKTVLLLAAIAASFTSFSQTQIGNSNFEAWETTSNEIKEPVNWNSFKTATGTWNSFGGQQMNWSSLVRPGSTGIKSAVIWAKSTLGVVANGNMTLGRIEMGSTTASSSSNYNYSQTTDAAFSETIPDAPDSIVFWVKYKPVTAGTNTARISAIITNNTNNYKDPNDVGGANTVATAILNFPTTSNAWVRKSVPFTYVGSASNAAYIITTFTTNSTPGGGSANDSLYIDDIELIYNPVNQPVVANDDAISTPQDQSVAVSVLSNDVDPENALNFSSLAVTVAPTNGTTSVNTTTGVVTYTPNAGWFGTDVFTYTICDNGTPVLCDQAVVTVTVTEVIVGNNQIIANDDVATTNMNTPVVTNVLANDVDVENQINNSTLNVTIQPTNGTTSVNTTTGEITYTPTTGYFGNDSYTYAICDFGTPAVTCDTAVVNVTVNLNWGVNEVGAEEIQVTFENQIIHVLGNDLSGTYALFASNGQLVQNGELSSEIQTRNLKGIYFMTIMSSKGNATKKISIL
ncbi:MAG: hypothetical protein RI922_241 [Bacteroidota bacterium]